MTIIQIMVCIVYGILFNIPTNVINVASVIITILLAILTIAGINTYIQDSDLYFRVSNDWRGQV